MNQVSKILMTALFAVLVAISATGCARNKATQESGLVPYQPAERAELGAASSGSSKSGYQAPYSK